MVYSHQGDIRVVARANWTCLKDFFWRGKWGEKQREKERGRGKKSGRVIFDSGRDKDREREREGDAVIGLITYSHGGGRMG